MTATANAAGPEQGRRGFSLPSAYTILFLLIVIVALLTWIIPAGQYDVDADGEPIPGTYHTVEANPQRIVVDSLMAPINGLYGIEAPRTAASASGTRASCSGPSTSPCSSWSSADSSGSR